MDTREKVRFGWLRWALLALGALLIFFLIFDAGVAVGMRYSMGMRGPGGHVGMPAQQFGFGGFGIAVPHGYIPEGHGAVGTIQTIDATTITLQTREGGTQVVAINANTHIQSATTTGTLKDLRPGQTIVVLGDPHEATSSQQLTAAFIRILR